MPKSQIIKDLVEDLEPIEKSMTRLLVLAKDVNNMKIEAWAEQELSGYENNKDAPDYRKFKSDLIRYSGINGGFQVNNIPLPLGMLDSDTLESVRNVVICDGLHTISEFAQKESVPVRDLTWLASIVSNRTDGMVTCTSIEQVLPPSFYQKLHSTVKNKMITVLCELEKEYGCLDNLVIDISKMRLSQVIAKNDDLNRAIFKINVPEHRKEPWYSKVAWSVITPIITGIVGAIGATLIIQLLGI